MQEKQTNLVLSADVDTTQEVIDLVKKTAHLLLGVKLHSDILKECSRSFFTTLYDMATQYNFIIIEDRKFCDIGNTVQRQMENIAWYADLVTVHGVSGPGVLDGLRKSCKEHDCGVLLLAEMSSKDNLIDTTYTKRVIQMAQNNSDIVVGFIGQQKYTNVTVCDTTVVTNTTGGATNTNFLTFTPGVHTSGAGDQLGQQYNTPEHLVGTKNVDVLIVGRGIYQSADPVQACKDHIYTPKMALCSQLKATGVIKHGDFTLKSGEKSTVYADFRLLLGHPGVMNSVVKQIIPLIDPNPNVLIVGVPLGALPISSIIANQMQRQMIMIRDKPKDYGRQNQIEGIYTAGQHCVVIEDVLTSGGSVLSTIQLLKENGLQVDRVIAILDREKGAPEKLESEGYPTLCLFRLSELEQQKSC